MVTVPLTPDQAPLPELSGTTWTVLEKSASPNTRMEPRANVRVTSQYAFAPAPTLQVPLSPPTFTLSCTRSLAKLNSEPGLGAAVGGVVTVGPPLGVYAMSTATSLTLSTVLPFSTVVVGSASAAVAPAAVATRPPAVRAAATTKAWIEVMAGPLLDRGAGVGAAASQSPPGGRRGQSETFLLSVW